MEINVKIDPYTLANSLTIKNLNEILAEFSDDEIMDCLEHQDTERADWIIANRMVKLLKTITNSGIDDEIEEYFQNGSIDKDTYNVFKLLRNK